MTIRTLPGDLAIHDPDPRWSEIHRVVGISPRKKFETAGPSSTSYTIFRISTACEVEFDSRIEPTSDDGVPGNRCPICYRADTAAA